MDNCPPHILTECAISFEPCFDVEGKLEEHEGNYFRCQGVGSLSVPET